MKKIFLFLVVCSVLLQATYTKIGGIITDSKTGLMWQDDYTDNGGSIKMSNWSSAIAYCNDLNASGYDDWRLPNVNELASITDDQDSTEPAIDIVFDQIQFSNLENNPWFWSSTTFARSSISAWGVCFKDGHVTVHDKIETHRYVRCVRNEGRTPGNTPPAADAGPDRNVEVNRTITVTDNDGAIDSNSIKVNMTNPSVQPPSGSFSNNFK